MLPLAALFAGDLLLGLYQLMFIVYLSFAASVAIGRWLAHSRKPARIGGAVFLGALQFFVVTNFALAQRATVIRTYVKLRPTADIDACKRESDAIVSSGAAPEEQFHVRGGGGFVWAGGSTGCDGGGALRFPWPKFGFCALQSATSCGLICGKGLLARRGCGVPRIIGAMQSTKMPSPVLARPRSNPACLQAALISAHAG